MADSTRPRRYVKDFRKHCNLRNANPIAIGQIYEIMEGDEVKG
jgi:hypothetical protein